MLRPKNTKFKKFQKGFLNRKNFKAVSYLEKDRIGKFTIKALQHSRFSDQQINAIQHTLSKIIRRKVKMELKLFPQLPVTGKPLEVRMGKGKGSIDFWAAFVVPGSVVLEGCSKNLVIFENLLKSSFNKLPFQVSFSK